MIVTINDLSGRRILTTPCSDLGPLEFEDVFRKLERELTQQGTGVGLAAPQIGISRRAFIVDWNGQKYRFANSIIGEVSDPTFDIEGCLSIPGREFRVLRPSVVTIIDDINGTQQYTGFLARIIQHEHDHTQGITLLQAGVEITQ